MSGKTNEFDQFYQQLAELKEIHRLHPNLQVEDLEKNYRKRSREEMEEDRMVLYVYVTNSSYFRHVHWRRELGTIY